MRQRCGDSNCSRYKYYGARGIAVCKEWANDFSVFRDWAIQNGYSEGLTIDRIDNDGVYEPTNCRWITFSENIRKMNLERRARKEMLGGEKRNEEKRRTA
jgi:hypothetical protein